MDIRKLFKESNVLFEEKPKDKIPGGLADNKTTADVAKHHDVDEEQISKQLIKGINVEKEHTDDVAKAREVALDHLWEDPAYYDKLKTIEKN